MMLCDVPLHPRTRSTKGPDCPNDIQKRLRSPRQHLDDRQHSINPLPKRPAIDQRTEFVRLVRIHELFRLGLIAKLKTRTMYDLHAGIRAILEVIPPQFRLDLDFNGSLVTAAQALPLLKSLEQYEQVAMIETPIPQKDVAGNQQIRRRLNRPIAMHIGDPPIATAITQDVTDGFIIGGPAKELLKAATVCEVANKPFWLQMVGTGITTTWAAHVAAVCSHARWPSITSMNIWESQLVERPIQVRGGYYPVPEEPGLGVEVDETALKKYAVDHDDVKPPKHLYRYSRASGEVTYYGCASKSVLHGTYVRDGMPICEAGSNLEVMVDDGSPAFDQLYTATRNGQTVRRSESAPPV